MLFMSFVCHAFKSVHCCLEVTCWERAGGMYFDIFIHTKAHVIFLCSNCEIQY